MAQYTVSVVWSRAGQTFTDNRYSRAHRWKFDGGADVPGSSSPHVVRLPYSDPAGVDPEEAFVAAISSCHMLTFLYIAAMRGFVVDSYEDDAVGVMGKNSQGREAMTVVTLRPKVVYGGTKVPSAQESQAMHHQAHEECYIANSVKTEIRCEPV